MNTDEYLRLRDRLNELEAILRTLQDNQANATGSTDGIGVTFKLGSTYPTAAGSCFAIRKANPGGAETEGSALTITQGTGVVMAGNLGTVLPPIGSNVIYTTIGPRMVFKHG